jgi:hypothetical protein
MFLGICAMWIMPQTNFNHAPTFNYNEVMRLLELVGVAEKA